MAIDGLRLASAGDYGAALVKYEAAWTAQPRDDIALAAAEAACQLGQLDDAFLWLDRLSGQSDVTEALVSTDPDLSRARMYTRFAQVLTRIAARALQVAVDVGAGLSRTTPSAEGIDPIALETLVRAAETSGSSALVLLSNGKLVGQWYFGAATQRIESMSGTKSMVELAIAILIGDGRIKSFDQPVWNFFPEWKQGRKESITLRLLLNHTSGLAGLPTTTPEINAISDFVRFAVDSQLISDPGAAFSYNGNAANLLAGVVERASGQTVDAFLRARLFTPLGIRDVTWSHDFSGHALGMSGMQIHPLDWAKIGQLLLDGGVWNGQQLIRRDLIDEAARPAQPFTLRCGLLWWIKYEAAQDDQLGKRYGFSAVGKLGQFLLVIPAQHLVAVRMADGTKRQPDSDADLTFFALVHALKSK